jgi:ABC-type amino acid transport system permease subunit
MVLDFSVWIARWPYLLGGALISLQLVLAVLLISAPFAAIVALGLTAKARLVAASVAVLSWMIRVLPQLGIDLPPMVAAITGFVIYNAFLFGEVIAAGFRSLHKGQYDAIAALGLPPLRTYFRILLPQALPSIIPPYISYSTDMVKGTALAGSIGVLELVTRANQTILTTNKPFEVLIGVALIYGIVDAILIGIQTLAEKRWSKRSRH